MLPTNQGCVSEMSDASCVLPTGCLTHQFQSFTGTEQASQNVRAKTTHDSRECFKGSKSLACAFERAARSKPGQTSMQQSYKITRLWCHKAESFCSRRCFFLV